MKKFALYTGFTALSFAELAMFFTSKTYPQLIIAILLYLPLAYFAFKLFPRKARAKQTFSQEGINAVQTVLHPDTTDHTTTQQGVYGDLEISDINKRAFLKIIGATGISFFVSSLFSKKVESQIFGKPEEPSLISIQDSTGNIIDPAKQHPTENYKISEVDYGLNTFYGFIDENEAWFIIKEDMNAGTYRYAKGDNNFPDNWNSREDLKYDYYNRVFTKP